MGLTKRERLVGAVKRFEKGRQRAGRYVVIEVGKNKYKVFDRRTQELTTLAFKKGKKTPKSVRYV